MTGEIDGFYLAVPFMFITASMASISSRMRLLSVAVRAAYCSTVWEPMQGKLRWPAVGDLELS